MHLTTISISPGKREKIASFFHGFWGHDNQAATKFRNLKNAA
jgi:hypothetical protein